MNGGVVQNFCVCALRAVITLDPPSVKPWIRPVFLDFVTVTFHTKIVCPMPKIATPSLGWARLPNAAMKFKPTKIAYGHHACLVTKITHYKVSESCFLLLFVGHWPCRV